MEPPIVFDDGSGKRESSPSFSRLREGVLTEGRLGQGLLLVLDSCQNGLVGTKHDVKGTFGWIPLSSLSGRNIHRIPVGSGLSSLWPVANARSFRRRSPCLLPTPSSLFRPASVREGWSPAARVALPPKGGEVTFLPPTAPRCPWVGRRPVGEEEDQSINVTPCGDEPESRQRCASHSFFPKARRTR